MSEAEVPPLPARVPQSGGENDAPPVTIQRVQCGDARNLDAIDQGSVDLVVTSPPYPMIRMWDGLFSSMSSDAAQALAESDGQAAFEAMHRELDKVWTGLFRVIAEGGFLCINIGDATRTIGGSFALYPNHARITSACTAAGFTCLPLVLWKKTTNAPNKFMGSGMLPAGAYVTLEHEYILIFRKGDKRAFDTTDARRRRMESAFFWEERNSWFSDTWNLSGVRQELPETALRDRSAAYPFELAYRLILMYSHYGDTVLDPFCGTGTTLYAALAAGRSGIGVDTDPSLTSNIIDGLAGFIPQARQLGAERLARHDRFVTERTMKAGAPKHFNDALGTPVMTRQETALVSMLPHRLVSSEDSRITVSYTTVQPPSGLPDNRR